MARQSGFYRTNLPGRAQYESFVPAPLPPEPPLEISEKISRLLCRTHRQLDRLNTLAAEIKDISLLMPLLLKREALLSIRAEGSTISWSQLLDPGPDSQSPAAADVHNYARALALGLDLLRELPLCKRLLRQVQAVLLDDRRYEKQSPGEFRTSQNWLGDKESTIQTAWYVPPSLDDMDQALVELEKYIHAEDGLDDLLRAGLIHYQFFAIHPFLAGNNRTNRILAFLYLLEKEVLASPVLAFSAYFSQHRSEYYKSMLAVYNRGTYEEWLSFFLLALEAAAEDSYLVLTELARLQARNKAWVDQQGRAAKNTGRVLDWFMASQPADLAGAVKELGLARSTVARSVQRLLAAGIVKQARVRGRSRQYICSGLAGIFEEVAGR